MTNYILTANGELYHHGIKGMKWGVRRVDKKADKYRAKIQKYSGSKLGSSQDAKRMKYDRKLDKLLQKTHAYDDFGTLSTDEKLAAQGRIKLSKYARSEKKYHEMTSEEQREVDNYYAGAMFMQNFAIKYSKNSSDRRAALANAWVLASEYEQITHSEPVRRLTKQDRQELRELEELERMENDPNIVMEQWNDYYRRTGR